MSVAGSNAAEALTFHSWVSSKFTYVYFHSGVRTELAHSELLTRNKAILALFISCWRKVRGVLQSIIPGRCPTVIQPVLRAIPSLFDRFDAISLHVPVFSGAMVDLNFRTKEPVGGAVEIIGKPTKCRLL
ncbi:uncharacterized protein DEA37_0007733 [Paragonimus westermani]|uniref:Uncharacterized protein n=1 Tax=Paragonimus westermani TaxID=34504 RepID=A0A5J4N9Z0_9TREM|nr:uncharacterized protein DEA37_0007733 [Paragonimus westermani]